jgi:hypothetical protein
MTPDMFHFEVTEAEQEQLVKMLEGEIKATEKYIDLMRQVKDKAIEELVDQKVILSVQQSLLDKFNMGGKLN